MTDAQLLHTADLDRATREAARALLEDVFEGDLTDDDWDHALGGMHALTWEGAELVGHASVVQRQMIHGGRTLRAGAVEGVGVRRDRRGRGYGRALMRSLERVIRGAYDVGVLGSTDEALAFYKALAWRRWRGTTWALTPDGIVRTEDDDDSVLVLPLEVPIDPSGKLTCDWRWGALW